MSDISNVCGALRNAVQRRRHNLYCRKCNAGKVETKRGLKCMKKCEKRETYSEQLRSKETERKEPGKENGKVH